ncbi:hypothetical protein HDU76_012747 [Blyttiomyces sp. JEL0837]|nr:hypothetical protein HDU76_012747 [Blyttiomyces sp. JEL0837]
MISHCWLAHTNPILFQNIQLTLDNTDPFVHLVRLWSQISANTTNPVITPCWTKYIHYIQIKTPIEPDTETAKDLETERLKFYKWSRDLREAIGSCINLKGVFSPYQFFPGFFNDRTTGFGDWILKTPLPFSLTHLNLWPFSKHVAFLLPSTGSRKLSATTEARRMNLAFGKKVLNSVDSFNNVRFLCVNMAAIDIDSVDLSPLLHFINLKSLSVIVENGQSVGRTLPSLTSFLPTSIKFLSLQISSMDLDLFGRTSQPDRVSMNQELDIKEFQLEVFPSSTPLFILSLSHVKTGYKRLGHILPFDHVDILRLVSRNNIWIYEEPEHCQTTTTTSLVSNQLAIAACKSRIDFSLHLNRIAELFNSAIWSLHLPLALPIHFDFEVKDLLDEDVNHLQLQTANIEAAVAPLFRYSTTYERIQSFSIVGLPGHVVTLQRIVDLLSRMKNVTHLSVHVCKSSLSSLEFVERIFSALQTNCLLLRRVLIHEAGGDYDDSEDVDLNFFETMMGLLVGENGLPKSVRKVWVQQNGGVDFSSGWVGVAEKRGIVVEPFYDPFRGITYPRSVSDVL